MCVYDVGVVLVFPSAKIASNTRRKHGKPEANGYFLIKATAALVCHVLLLFASFTFQISNFMSLTVLAVLFTHRAFVVEIIKKKQKYIQLKFLIAIRSRSMHTTHTPNHRKALDFHGLEHITGITHTGYCCEQVRHKPSFDTGTFTCTRFQCEISKFVGCRLGIAHYFTFSFFAVPFFRLSSMPPQRPLMQYIDVNAIIFRFSQHTQTQFYIFCVSDREKRRQ